MAASALPAGNNNIGDVDVASIAAGDNNIGNVDIVTLPAVFGAVSVDVNAAVTADVDAAVAAAANLRLMGFNVRETKSTAAVCTGKVIHGATGATNAPLAAFELAADTSQTFWFGPQGIACASGLSVDHIAGEFDIILYYLVAA